MGRPSVSVRTWIIFGVALALVGFSVFLLASPNADKITSTPTPTAQETILFPADQGIVIKVNIKDKAGKEVEVARDPATGVWVFSLPRQGSTIPGSVDSVTAQVIYLSILTRLDPASDPAIYGLKTPAYIVTLHFQNGPAKSLKIGDATPTGSGYYARLDDGSLVVLSKGAIDGFIALSVAPPFAETETPTPLPATATPTVTPTLPATATPEGGATVESAPPISPTETTTAEALPTETTTATPTP